MSKYHGGSVLSQLRGVSHQSPPKALDSETKLTPGSVKEPAGRARRRHGLNLSKRGPAMVHSSSVGKRENQKITGKELKKLKALLQTGKKTSHSSK